MGLKSLAARGKNIQTAATKAAETKEMPRRPSDRGLATLDRPLASGGHRKKQVRRSIKAGLLFPVGRIGRYLKEGRYSQHVGSGAPIYLAAVLEYLAAEVLELAGKAYKESNKICIIPKEDQNGPAV